MHIFHQWEARSVHYFTARNIGYDNEHLVTEVLYVCKICGKSKTKELEGKWELKDLIIN